MCHLYYVFLPEINVFVRQLYLNSLSHHSHNPVLPPVHRLSPGQASGSNPGQVQLQEEPGQSARGGAEPETGREAGVFGGPRRQRTLVAGGEQ